MGSIQNPLLYCLSGPNPTGLTAISSISVLQRPGARVPSPSLEHVHPDSIYNAASTPVTHRYKATLLKDNIARFTGHVLQFDKP